MRMVEINFFDATIHWFVSFFYLGFRLRYYVHTPATTVIQHHGHHARARASICDRGIFRTTSCIKMYQVLTFDRECHFTDVRTISESRSTGLSKTVILIMVMPFSPALYQKRFPVLFQWRKKFIYLIIVLFQYQRPITVGVTVQFAGPTGSTSILLRNTK